jgi:hypothetical protein
VRTAGTYDTLSLSHGAAIVLSLLFACYYRFLYGTQRSLASQCKEKEAGQRCASEKDISYSGEEMSKSWKRDL